MINVEQLTDAEKCLLIEDEIRRTKLLIHEETTKRMSRIQKKQHEQKREMEAALAAVVERRQSKELQLKKLLLLSDQLEKDIEQAKKDGSNASARSTRRARECRQLEHDEANLRQMLVEVQAGREAVGQRVERHRRQVAQMTQTQAKYRKERDQNIQRSLKAAEEEDAMHHELATLQQENKELLEELSRVLDRRKEERRKGQSVMIGGRSAGLQEEGDAVGEASAGSSLEVGETMKKEATPVAPLVAARARTAREDELYAEFEKAVYALLATIR